jgi:tyrosyl-tRNA synthetase
MVQGTFSSGEAQNILKAGGFYLNGVKVNDVKRTLKAEDLLDGRMAILRTGAENHLILLLDPESVPFWFTEAVNTVLP